VEGSIYLSPFEDYGVNRIEHREHKVSDFFAIFVSFVVRPVLFAAMRDEAKAMLGLGKPRPSMGGTWRAQFIVPIFGIVGGAECGLF
jgi:hypothetical protein